MIMHKTSAGMNSTCIKLQIQLIVVAMPQKLARLCVETANKPGLKVTAVHLIIVHLQNPERRSLSTRCKNEQQMA